MLHDVFSELLKKRDEASSPFDLLRVPVRTNRRTHQLPVCRRSIYPRLRSRFLELLDHSVDPEHRAILELGDVRSRKIVLCSTTVLDQYRTP